MERLFAVFAAHNIRYFFYAGGNDSQDTSHKIHEEAVKRGYDLVMVTSDLASMIAGVRRHLDDLKAGA